MQFVSRAMSQYEMQFVPHEKALRWCVLSVLFIASLVIRFYRIADPPLEFHATRQFHSAVIARGYYRASDKTISDWQREVAVANMEQRGVIEPPIMEHLAVLGYRLAGGEYLWIPCALSATFWVIGGILLFLLGEQILSTDAAFAAAGFYLLFPYGFVASRSFQPESLMVMMLVAGLLAIVHYFRKPTISRVVFAAGVSAIALFVKPFAGFFIFGVYGALAIWHWGVRRFVRHPHNLLFMVLSLTPAAAYYVNGLFIAGFLAGRTQLRFLPSLLLSPFYWGGWMAQIGVTVGYVPFMGALIGISLIRPKTSRVFLLGLWLGYVLFGLTFNYHIHTHSYYHLPFVPVVALSISPLITAIMHKLREAHPFSLWRTIFAACIIGIAVALRVLDVHSGACFHVGGNPNVVRIGPEIGEYVEHSLNTVFLADSYGIPLQYYGELGGLSWPTSGDFYAAALWGRQSPSVEERLSSQENLPGFFIVTNFYEFGQQTDLREYLYANYPVLVENPEYLIFDLRERMAP